MTGPDSYEKESDEYPDDECPHEQDTFDDFEYVYELVLPKGIHLTQICNECRTTYFEEFLTPDPEDDFKERYAMLKQQEEQGEIADVSVRYVNQDGINVEVQLVKEIDEETGYAVVREKPYYFWY